jgi:hypothetical protein
MLARVATNNLFKLIVSKWIWKRSEIVNDISETQVVRVDADGSQSVQVLRESASPWHFASSSSKYHQRDF